MEIVKDKNLQPYNTFGIAVKAAGFAGFQSVDELQELLSVTDRYKKFMVLGGGSNVLFLDNYEGLVLKNDLKGIETAGEDDEQVFIKAAAGEVWHELVVKTLEMNLAGLENLSLIPGSTGASPMQNIGAYGQEIQNVFHELEAYHINDKVLVKFNRQDCEFGYRESVFKNKYRDRFVILNVTYALNKKPALNTSYGAIEQELLAAGIIEPTIKDVSDAVIRIRRSKLPDPAETGNAGSFFKNPVISTEQFRALQMQYPAIVGFAVDDNQTKLAAGWLIEQCGLKGLRKGDAGVHARQALVLVNYGNASGKEIYDLSEEIVASVQQKFGVTLQREVNMIG